VQGEEISNVRAQLLQGTYAEHEEYSFRVILFCNPKEPTERTDRPYCDHVWWDRAIHRGIPRE